MLRRAQIVVLTAVLAACASKPRPEAPPEPEVVVPVAVEVGDYVPSPSYPATTVAELRAAPPPATPLVAIGTNPEADAQRLQALAQVRIGTGHLPGAPADSIELARAQAVRSGADQALLYPTPPPDAAADAAAGAGTVVAHYVRFRLPFGARFRDLNEAERTRLGVAGGVMLGAIIGDSPASQANLLEGDVVLRMGGKALADAAEFRARLRENAGRTVTLTIWRGGTTLARPVRLGAAPPLPVPETR
ncbi:MAG: PDZ domain-containing protein [Xanthomonadales bacterium]|nr:PDZ domain-containing protein [Xanthomonadales bacterium]